MSIFLFGDRGKRCMPVSVLAACAMAIALCEAAHAQTTSAQTTSAKGGKLDFGSHQYILNNTWGDIGGIGSESITVKSPTSWSTTYDWKRVMPLGVRSYPSSVLGWQFGIEKTGTGLPVRLSSHTSIKTTAAFQVTGKAMEDIAYDCWFHSIPNPGKDTKPTDEMMIWEAALNGPGPIGTVVATAAIDGHTWNLFEGSNSFGWKVHTFVIKNGPLTGATLNLTDFTDYLVHHGYLKSSSYIDGVLFGTEVVFGSGTLDVTHYTCTIGPVPSKRSHGK